MHTKSAISLVEYIEDFNEAGVRASKAFLFSDAPGIGYPCELADVVSGSLPRQMFEPLRVLQKHEKKPVSNLPATCELLYIMHVS